MRQPTNLRGATLPGLSQPSKKEGPHHRSFWLPRLQRQADSLSLSGRGGARHLRLRQQSTAPGFRWQGNPSRFREQSPTNSQPGVTSDLQVFFWVLLLGWFCWFSKVTNSVWELDATESEARHLNCPGNMTACCSVGHINHRKLGADGADVNLAGGHWPVSEIPKVYHHFLSSSRMAADHDEIYF